MSGYGEDRDCASTDWPSSSLGNIIINITDSVRRRMSAVNGDAVGPGSPPASQEASACHAHTFFPQAQRDTPMHNDTQI